MGTVFKGAKLIPGSGNEAIDNSLLIVNGSTIEYAGQFDESICKKKVEEGYQIIDCSGKSITPGFIDCHVHLCGILSENVRDWVLEPNEQQAIVSTVEAWKVISAGVTTVGDVSENGLRLKKLIKEGSIPGPEIVACGRGFCRTGGYIDCSDIPVNVINESHPWAIIVNGKENIRKQTRLLIRKNADAVKIWPSSSGASPYRLRDTDQLYSLDEIKMAVDEAAMLKLPVFAHCESVEGTKAALKAGVQNIIHGEELDEECLELFLEKGACLMPTLKITLDWLNYDYDEIPRRINIEKYDGNTINEKEYNRVVDNFMTAYSRGIKIALASDTFCQKMTPYGHNSLDEIKEMVKAGMSPLDAITASTKNGAEAMGLGDKKGVLEEGKDADFIIMDIDPLTEMDKLSSLVIEEVWKQGKKIKKGGDQYV